MLSSRSLFVAVVVAVLSSSILVTAYSGSSSSMVYGGSYGQPMAYDQAYNRESHNRDYGGDSLPMLSGWHRGTGTDRYRRSMSNGWGQMNPYDNNRDYYGYNQGMNGYSNSDYYGYGHGNNRDYYGYGQGMSYGTNGYNSNDYYGNSYGGYGNSNDYYGGYSNGYGNSNHYRSYN
mmetsp:Transcript_17903/g.25940  ORF Transcript_17903/g.25940 Transcript_17903/m.25940 type:complete len:175 (+) Transcript_17903:256-780(+)